jgi:poly-gamma-glutamate capsule biosynthesis protein CapA/YwtB (metallophosphatase superfamily)
MGETTIIIGGDVCPVRRSVPYFCNGGAEELWKDFQSEFESADFAVANLECPLIERETPIAKTGPVLEAPSECVNGLVQAGIRCLGLANNHILDHGAEGLENTLRVCSAAGILTFGAGRNLEESGRMLVVNAGSLRIGLLGAAAQEWSIAVENSPGANPLDAIDCARSLQRHRSKCDFVIFLLHDGAELYPYPSPRLRKVCRFLIEQGAGIVVCQHSHCAGAYEAYEHGHIIYGQGNLIHDAPERNGAWHEGFLIRLSITADLSSTWQPVPYVQWDPLPGIRRMSPERERAFLADLTQRSVAIKDEAFVAQAWEQLCREHRHAVTSFVLGHGPILRRLNRKGRVVKHMLGTKRLRQIRNSVMSDTHREVVLEVLNQCLKEG